MAAMSATTRSKNGTTQMAVIMTPQVTADTRPSGALVLRRLRLDTFLLSTAKALANSNARASACCTAASGVSLSHDLHLQATRTGVGAGDDPEVTFFGRPLSDGVTAEVKDSVPGGFETFAPLKGDVEGDMTEVTLTACDVIRAVEVTRDVKDMAALTSLDCTPVGSVTGVKMTS